MAYAIFNSAGENITPNPAKRFKSEEVAERIVYGLKIRATRLGNGERYSIREINEEAA